MDPIELRTADGLQLGSVKLWRFLTCSNACLARAKSLYTKMRRREYAFEPLSMWKLEMFCCAKYRFWARHLPFPKSFFNVFNIFWLFCALFRFDGFWTHNYCILYTFQQLLNCVRFGTSFQRPTASEKLKKSIDEFCRIIEGEDRLLILLSRRYIPPLCAFAGQEWFYQGGAL